jgi:hypothetical protein
MQQKISLKKHVYGVEYFPRDSFELSRAANHKSDSLVTCVIRNRPDLCMYSRYFKDCLWRRDRMIEKSSMLQEI